MHGRNPLEKRLYRRGRLWWFWGWDYRDVQYKVSTHQTERGAALAWARAEERRRAVPPDPKASKPEAVGLTLGELFSKLRQRNEMLGLSKRTLEVRRNHARHFVEFFGLNGGAGANRRVSPDVFGPDDVVSYITHRLSEGAGTDQQRHTVAMEVGTLVLALHNAKKLGLYDGDPKTMRVEFSPAKFYRPGTGWIRTAEQCNALVAEISAQHPRSRAPRIDRRLHVLAYLHTGVRAGELFLIKPEHVDLARRLVHVDGTKTDGAWRYVALSDTAHEVFARALKGARRGAPLFAPWPGRNKDLRTAWARVLAGKTYSGVRLSDPPEVIDALPRDLKFNDLRRSFCSMLAANGVPEHHCADLLGHASVKMVRAVYRQVCPEVLHDAVAVLPKLTLPALDMPKAARTTTRRRASRAL